MNNLLSSTFPRGSDLEAGVVDVEMAVHNSEKSLAGFFEEVGKIKSDMDRVQEVLLKLQDANEEGKSIHKAKAMKALRARMDQHVEEVLKLARSIKAQVEELDKANASNRRVKGCEAGSPTDRTRMAITNSLRKKLKDLMGDFSNLRERMMNEYRGTVERRYYTVTGEQADEATIEHIIETGQSESFLQKAIQEQGRGQIIETIHEIQERHDAVKEIEKNLLELHRIFLDMATLVEAQGEQLYNIELNVNKASSFVERGTGQLRIAKKNQRSTRKWTCIAIIILLIIIAIIVVPIVTKK